MMLLPMVVGAQETVEIDGIWYNLIEKGKVAEVTNRLGGSSEGSGSYKGSVVIPDSVTYNGVEYDITSIGQNAFYGCTSLTTITIPNSVSSIEENVFKYCTALMTVKSYITEPFSINNFENETYRQGKLYVPKGTKELYVRFDGWREFLKIEEMEYEHSPNGECATPTITLIDNKFKFHCATPGAEFTSSLTTEEIFTGDEVSMSNDEITYTLTVYATAPGYDRSQPATYRFTLKKCDVNQDGAVDVADIATIIDKMAGKENKPGETQTFTVNGVSFTMIGVEGGTFMMGNDNSDALRNEKPVHQVTVSSFSIGQTEVTQALWYSVMGTNPSQFKSMKLPVEMVSWDDCQTFITKLNQITGQQFRLPTEAEWEFAARGGNKSQGYKYAGSNYINDVAWFSDNENFNTHEVGTKWPNELNIYDMSGNVWEWCQDWYGDYSSDAQTNPTGPESGDSRVFRGGGYLSTKINCEIVYRASGAPTKKTDSIGFRLAL